MRQWMGLLYVARFAAISVAFLANCCTACLGAYIHTHATSYFLQNDGNVILWQNHTQVLWTNNKHLVPNTTPPYRLTLQRDGNLVGEHALQHIIVSFLD